MTERPRLPFWFRAVVASGFALLFGAFLLVRDRGTARAVAPRPTHPAAERGREELAADHTTTGDYRVNGVPVRSRRLWIAGSGERALESLAREAETAGYRTRRTSIVGSPAMLGLHPKSGVLVSATIEEESAGRTLVRLAEQRLRRIDDARHLLPPDVAVLGGARDLLVVTPIDSTAPATASYSVPRPPSWTARAIGSRMRDLGWQPLTAPGEDGADRPRWFAKERREASVVVRAADDGSSLVVIALGGPGR